MSSEYENAVLPPQDLDAERGVLGSVLFLNAALDEITSMLTEKHFYSIAHSVMFAAICRLHQRGVLGIDAITLAEELVSAGQLETAGGVNYLMEVINAVPHASHVRYYAAIVAELSNRRELIYLCREAVRNAYDRTLEISDTMGKVMSNVEMMFGRSSGDAREIKDVIASLRQIQLNPPSIISTGLIDLDNHLKGPFDTTGGFKSGQLILLGARPAMGKSAIAMKFLEAAAAVAAAMIIPLEMDGEELCERIQHQGKCRLDEFAGLPILVEDKKFDLESVISSIRMNHKRKGVRFVVIDYLTLIEVEGRENTADKIAKVTRRLKRLAKELKIPIVMLAQLNRKLEDRPDKRPQLADLKGSGCLSGSSLVYGLRGPRRIDDLVGNSDAHPVYSAHGGKWMNATNPKNTWKTGHRKVKTLTLSTGHRINATANHKFNREGEWQPLENLSAGDLIAVPLNCKYERKQTITLAEARLLGLFVSNGCTLPRRTLQITLNSLDQDLAEQIVKDLHEAFPGELRPHVKTESHDSRPGSEWIQVYAPSIRIPSKLKRSVLVDWLIAYGLHGKRAKEKIVPDVIFSQPREVVTEFLRALFSGDGTTGIFVKNTPSRNKHQYNVASYSSSSRQLIDGVQWLMQCLGILSGISTVSSRGFKNHVLSVYSRTFKNKFASDIGFIGERKQATMRTVIERMNNAKLGWEKYIADGDLVFVPIKSIVDAGTEDVFDMEVPETSNFVANGILVHNSIEQDADVVLFLYRHEVYAQGEKPGQCEVIIAKQRKGPTGTVQVGFLKEKTQFVNAGELPIDTSIDGLFEPNKPFR